MKQLTHFKFKIRVMSEEEYSDSENSTEYETEYETETETDTDASTISFHYTDDEIQGGSAEDYYPEYEENGVSDSETDEEQIQVIHHGARWPRRRKR